MVELFNGVGDRNLKKSSAEVGLILILIFFESESTESEKIILILKSAPRKGCPRLEKLLS